jgi:hypothetical protein
MQDRLPLGGGAYAVDMARQQRHSELAFEVADAPPQRVD